MLISDLVLFSFCDSSLALESYGESFMLKYNFKGDFKINGRRESSNFPFFKSFKSIFFHRKSIDTKQ